MNVAAMHAAVSDPSPKHPDRIVLFVLAWHADPDTGEAWPSVRTIASEAGVSTNTVVKALRRLVEVGRIEVVRAGSRQRSATYLCRALGATRVDEGLCRDQCATQDDRSVAIVSRLERDRSSEITPTTQRGTQVRDPREAAERFAAMRSSIRRSTSVAPE